MGAKICDAWAQDCTVYVFVGGDRQLMLGSDEVPRVLRHVHIKSI